jgi:hypothetical protein
MTLLLQPDDSAAINILKLLHLQQIFARPPASVMM